MSSHREARRSTARSGSAACSTPLSSDGRTVEQVEGWHAPDGIAGAVQNRAAACSAKGERTPFDSVMCPNRDEPRSFSISAAIPPNGEM